MIKTFRSAETERLFRLQRCRKFRAIERAALRRLFMLDAAPDLATLAAIPGNRLERLRGDRSLRVESRTGLLTTGVGIAIPRNNFYGA